MAARSFVPDIPDHAAATWWKKIFPDRKVVTNELFKEGVFTRFPMLASTETGKVIDVMIAFVIDTKQTGNVTTDDLDAFVKRFGPFEKCLDKCYASLFQNNKQIASWYHGEITNDEGSAMLKGTPDKSFLLRTGSKKSTFTLMYREASKNNAGRTVAITKKLSVYCRGPQGYDYKKPYTLNWPSLVEAIAYFDRKGKINLSRAVPSPLANKAATTKLDFGPMKLPNSGTSSAADYDYIGLDKIKDKMSKRETKIETS